MLKNIVMFYKVVIRLSICLIFALAGFSPVRVNAQNHDPSYSIEVDTDTINGIRYFKNFIFLRSTIEYPTLPDFRLLGFTIDPSVENLSKNFPDYITPDGKVIPNFHEALCVVAPNAENEWTAPVKGIPPKYSGDIYIPDRVEGFLDEKDPLYVLELNYKAMGEGVISLRTPIYALVDSRKLLYATNLQKVQIGAYYSVMPQAFLNCKKLQTVIFEQTPQVFTTAFSDSPDIKEIVLQSEENLPLLEGTRVFDDKVYTNATLYVPDTLMEACKMDPVWSKFSKIKSLKECNVELMKP